MASHDLHKWITSDIDFYALLGIELEACTEAELRRAYRKTALKYHPDKVGTNFDPEKYEIFQAAYEVLSNPSSKSQYDHCRLVKLQKQRADELFEGKRKQMKEDLEAREKNGISGAAKRQKADETQEPEFQSELRRLAEEGRKRRVERTRMMAENSVLSSNITLPKENNTSDQDAHGSSRFTQKDEEIERLERRIREVEELKVKRRAEKKARMRSRTGGQSRETTDRSAKIPKGLEKDETPPPKLKSSVSPGPTHKKSDFANTMARLKAAEKARQGKISLEQVSEAT